MVVFDGSCGLVALLAARLGIRTKMLWEKGRTDGLAKVYSELLL